MFPTDDAWAIAVLKSLLLKKPLVLNENPNWSRRR
jgi:hypothetical protein